jgi:hypothetical protein
MLITRIAEMCHAGLIAIQKAKRQAISLTERRFAIIPRIGK